MFEPLTSLTAGLELWRNRKNDNAQARRHRQDAVGLVMHAVVATKGYLYDLERGSPASRDMELSISQSWQRAAMAIREYDNSAQLKAMGWADPREWKNAESRPWAIKLDNIFAQCKWLQENA